MTPAEMAEACRRVAGEMEDCNMDGSALEAGAAALLEVDRLKKLFDDAGQGEHNVLALVEHYQDRAIASDEEVERLRARVAELEAELKHDRSVLTATQAVERNLMADLAASRAREERLREALSDFVAAWDGAPLPDLDTPDLHRLLACLAIARAALAEAGEK